MWRTNRYVCLIHWYIECHQELIASRAGALYTYLTCGEHHVISERLSHPVTSHLSPPPARSRQLAVLTTNETPPFL
jgi:hypothetical protein